MKSMILFFFRKKSILKNWFWKVNFSGLSFAFFYFPAFSQESNRAFKRPKPKSKQTRKLIPSSSRDQHESKFWYSKHTITITFTFVKRRSLNLQISIVSTRTRTRPRFLFPNSNQSMTSPIHSPEQTMGEGEKKVHVWLFRGSVCLLNLKFIL